MRTITSILSLAIISFSAIAPANAQRSAFQSGNGQTSIYLESGSAATFNFGDTKATIGHLSRHSTRRLFWGYEVFAQASTGVTTLFSSKIKVPEGGFAFVIGSHPLSKSIVSATRDNWVLLDVGYSRSSFYTASAPVPIDSAKHNFDRFRAIAAYNDKLSDHVIVGIAAGTERRNNLDDLTQITFQTTVIQSPSAGTASIVKSKDGFLGSYKQYVGAPIYTDLLFILPHSVKVPGFDSQIAIDGFTRSDIATANRSSDGGIGAFMTKKGSPTRVQGGLAASWNDGKGRVALVASYNF